MDEEELHVLTASLTAAVDFYEWSGGAGARIARMRTLLDRAAESREPLARLLLARVGELLESYGVDTRTAIPDQPAPGAPEQETVAPEPQQPLLALFQRPLPTAIAGQRREPADMQLQLEAQDTRLQRGQGASGAGVVRESGGVLRAGQIFRRRAQMRSAEKLLAEALATRPDSPGPLNPETLAWRSLKMMEDLAPTYLTRMVSYVESLVWIEEAEATLKAAEQPPRKVRRKPRANRKQPDLLQTSPDE